MEQKYLQRLQNVQSETEFNQILEDITNEPDYQKMCRELNAKVTKENEDLQNFNTEGMSAEQLQSDKKFVKEWEEFTETYELFNDVYCMVTASKWMPKEVKISSLTRAECDEIFERKAALLEEYDQYRDEVLIPAQQQYEDHKRLEELGRYPHYKILEEEEEINRLVTDPYFSNRVERANELDKQWNAECSSVEFFKGGTMCGSGTVENEKGQCVPIQTISQEQSTRGGGCLIATATYGSELASQVQQLREIRDNTLLQTESGSSFMESFNQFYYSFSPGIADLERENPMFKEVVKLAITPLLTSLSILNYVDMDSEETVLGYGISLILLNVGMYFVAPAMIILAIYRKHKPQSMI